MNIRKKMLNGLFDIDNRLEYLTENGDMLPKLKKLIPWGKFRSELNMIYVKDSMNHAGRRPFDVVLMFKIPVLQSLYNLSDDEMEYQIMDRLSFMRLAEFGIGFTHSRCKDALAVPFEVGKTYPYAKAVLPLQRLSE